MRQGVGNAISIMGARPTSNNYMLDGTANTDTSLGTPAAVLSIDAIQEFKEQTTTYSAEYGFSSNQINVISKTGTNAFHGTGFGFLRNEKLDARNFFDPPNAEKPQLDQKQFGFVQGGPVWLPFYDGRNKTFFLVNYEGTRIERGFSSFYTVPTPDQLAGRFTSTIIDPATGQAFANNTIPQTRFSRLAQLALRNGWYPAPNISAAQGNYQAIRTLPQEANQFTIRIDQDLAKMGRVFGRYTKSLYDNRTNSNLLDIGDRVFEQDTTNWQVSHTWAFRSNIVNQLRVGHVEARADQKGIGCPQGDVDFLQSTGTFTGLPDAQRECPSIGIQGFAGTGGAVNAYSASNQPMWDVSNQTTWMTGRHTLNFGVSYRRWWLQRDLATGFLGNYGFNVGFSGNPVADMLLGYYSTVGIFQPASFSVPGAPGNPREFNFKYIAPYFQDDWRVTSRLTVNLGMRWDYRNVPYETRNRMAWRNLDYGPGGLLVADPSLAPGGIVDGAYYQEAGRRSPENPDRVQGLCSQDWLCLAPDRRREDGVPRRLRRVLRFGGRPRDRRRRRCLPVREPQQLHPVGGAADAPSDLGHALSKLRGPGPGHAGREHVPRGQPIARAAQPVHAAMVARGAARVVCEHDARGQLHRHEGHQPPHAAQHRAGAGVQPPAPDGRRAQAVSQLHRLHRQRLGRQVEVRRLQHQTGAPRPRLAADAGVYVGEEYRHQVGSGRHRRDRFQRLAGLPEQPRSGARLRLVGLRRRPPSRGELCLQHTRSAAASASLATRPA